MWVSLHPLDRYLLVLKSAFRHSNELTFKLLWCERCFYHNTRKKEELVHCPERVKDKIIYNTLISPKHFLDVVRERKHVFKNSLKKKGVNNPISLKLLDNHVDCTESIVYQPDTEYSVSKSYNQSKPKLPFKYSIAYDIKILDVDVEKEEEPRGKPGVSIESVYADDAIKGAKSWMNDYEKYCNVDSDTGNEDSDWLVNYGTPDTEVPISDVGCGGCGAYLHCQEPSLPGYLPSEIFLECTRKDLESVLCQRCHFLKHYNTALSVHVNPDKYINLISRIKSEALVLLLVDLTDTAGSVWPEITNIIGKNRRIILIGNKVDLLWGDRPEWLNHVEKALRKCLPNSANVLDMCLISAKTGFGVEELVSKLHSVWRNRNDVYLVGCTNVGKSTLFNALIQSDYCKTKAVDLVQRATTAPWPGTTLNLLKFPILRPTAWKLHVRNARLNLDRSRSRRESELRKLQMRVQRKRQVTPVQLIGHIAHSFKEFPDGEDQPDMFNLPSGNVRNFKVEDQRISLVNKEIKEFEEGRWFFDTPGVLHRDQILNLLTAEELLITIPRDLIEPRTFLLHQGMSLFIAGLSRFDYVQGERPIRVTVFSSGRLPITICAIQHSCTVYEALLGSELTQVPQGSASRLSEWPGLSASDTITLCGVGSDESCADVMFSTTGWIAVTPEKNEICKFIAWSPMRRGISVRHPPLLPLAVKLRGKKMHRSPAYSRTSHN